MFTSLPKKESIDLAIAFLVGVLIFLGVILRLDTFLSSNASVGHVDPNRDFLIAQQIVNYGEWPLTGPDGHTGANANSPFYYYFLALIIFLFGNSLLTLSIVNLLIQCVSLPLVYLTARRFFGLPTALLSLFLFSTLSIFTNQAEHIWQPNIMHFLLIATLFFLSGYYHNRSKIDLYLAILFFALTTVTHNAALALIPSFVLGIVLLQRYWGDVGKKYFISIAFFILCELILFLPVFSFYIFQYQANNYGYNIEHIFALPGNILGRILHRSEHFLGHFFGFIDQSFEINAVFILFLALSIFVLGQKWSFPKRALVLYFYSVVFIMLLVLGLVNIADHYMFPLRYSSPIYPTLLLVFSATIVTLLRDSRIIVKLLPVMMIMLVILFNYSAVNKRVIDGVDYVLRPSYLLDNLKSKNSYQDPGVAPVMTLVKKHNLQGNFSIVTINSSTYPYINHYVGEELWVPIVLSTNAKQLMIDDHEFRGYRSVDDIEYLIIRCWGVSASYCDQYIKKEFPDSTLLEEIPSSEFVISLYKAP